MTNLMNYKKSKKGLFKVRTLRSDEWCGTVMVWGRSK